MFFFFLECACTRDIPSGNSKAREEITLRRRKVKTALSLGKRIKQFFFKYQISNIFPSTLPLRNFKPKQLLLISGQLGLTLIRGL